MKQDVKAIVGALFRPNYIPSKTDMMKRAALLFEAGDFALSDNSFACSKPLECKGIEHERSTCQKQS